MGMPFVVHQMHVHCARDSTKRSELLNFLVWSRSRAQEPLSHKSRTTKSWWRRVKGPSIIARRGPTPNQFSDQKLAEEQQRMPVRDPLKNSSWPLHTLRQRGEGLEWRWWGVHYFPLRTLAQSDSGSLWSLQLSFARATLLAEDQELRMPRPPKDLGLVTVSQQMACILRTISSVEPHKKSRLSLSKRLVIDLGRAWALVWEIWEGMVELTDWMRVWRLGIAMQFLAQPVKLEWT